MDTKAPQDRENKADDRLSAQVNNIQWRSLERRSSLASPLHPRFWAALRASAWARRLPVRSLSAAVGAQSRDSCSPCLSRSAFRLTRSSTGNRCRIPCRLFLFGDTPWLGCTDHIDKQSWVFTTSLPSFYMRKLYAQNDSERSTSPCCITPASHDFLSGTDAGGPAASIPPALHAERGYRRPKSSRPAPGDPGREHLARCAQLKSGPRRTQKTPQPIPLPMGSVRAPAVACACASQIYPTNIRLYNSSIHRCLFSGISPEARDSTSTC